MAGRTAGNKVQHVHIADLICRQSHIAQVNHTIVKHRVNGIPNSARFFMDFLHHEVLESAFFGSLCIPLYLGRFLLNFVAVQIKEADISR